ncbi:DUF298-domain-containing protein [Cutaneotrichosporon oleaginosum]|uniref:Defective in cullin neddylation protein n=1 Tax=Cutaneotrichosporon oleaginosum TaxID=879819 RepID=A0A0J0XNP9_9TREE|nr:DUF298-domain-containing protein [Cutaneotrichosporon oleaginosum]KLT42756.1 DUF298-domain-containing protein [Cutaneotrichosporon oleaginosum]TXT09525.1 hypothetical protein COLE_03459 [Cutaneotrichosporon oleaginosum]
MPVHIGGHTPRSGGSGPVLCLSAVNAFPSEHLSSANRSAKDAERALKKYRWILNVAIDEYFNSGGGAPSSSTAGNAKKVGDIWERFKDPSRNLITIEGFMNLCQELDIDPESDIVLFCLASDLGSKSIGEFAKEPFVSGWTDIDPGIDSVTKMKAALPHLRKKLNTDAAYFKKVYMHTFDLSKAEGARVLALDTALSMWQLFIPPAMAAKPSALSHVEAGQSPSGPATKNPSLLGESGFQLWLDFQKSRNKAVSKDTWSLFIDFVRTIDAEFKEYDESAAWPSTIDEFVEYAREHR